jgi:hypothetical protein
MLGALMVVVGIVAVSLLLSGSDSMLIGVAGAHRTE